MGFKQKIRNIKDCKDNSSIYDVYYKENIDESLIYFESRNGRDFAGNILRIIEEISTGRYGDFTIHVFANPAVKLSIEEFQKNYNLKIDRIITSEKEASQTLEKAKYIFTDSGIQYKYVKRPSQVFIDLWHGTPLKLMGIDYASEIASIGHIQHPLLSSDYLLYPNEYMMDIMLRAYQIEKIYPGKVLLEGYPRNAVFFDDKRRLEVKEKLGFEDREVFIYMPTYRGEVQKIDDNRDFIVEFLAKMDEMLDEDQLLIAKLHPYDESSIDYSNFNNVIPFPEGFETYDVLNVCDVLITDYSSVLFDFANTGKKIILYNYDEEKYLSSRGIYIPLDELPFSKVQDADALINELNTPKNYDDNDFLKKFCIFDNIDATERLCRHIFTNEKVCEEMEIENSKENILIYPGKITDSFINFAQTISEKYNIFITYNQWDAYFKENCAEIIEMLPENVELLPFRFNLTPTFDEKKDYNRYFASSDMECPESLNKLFKRSYDKQYQNIDFKAVIDFDATNPDVSSMFALSNANSVIWIHEDTFKKANANVLKNLLPKFGTVVADSSELAKKVREISDENIKISGNIEDILF